MKTSRVIAIATLVTALLIVVGLMAACGSPAPTPTPVPPTKAPEPTKPPATTAPATTGAIGATLNLTATAKSPVVPFLADWQKAGHANPTAEAFKHWPTATEKEVPVTCAKCHSSEGYRDFLGVDGSKVGVVDKAVPTGSLVDCVACHMRPGICPLASASTAWM